MTKLINLKSALPPEAAALQPVGTTCAQDTAPAYDEPNKKIGLLDLPYGTMAKNYYELLHPDLHTFYDYLH